MSRLEVQRRFYARYVTAKVDVTEPRIVEAFASVRRERFLGKGPWNIPVAEGYLPTETDDPIVLYQDILVGLDHQRQLNNGEPSLHAKCIGAALPQPDDLVIQVGAGTGYYTAIFAHLVGPAGRVEAYEINADLARRAARNLSKCLTVRLHRQSALEAVLPSANVIYVCAGATHVPPAWLDALAIGGRLVLPLTTHEGPGFMLLVTRLAPAGYAARILCSAYFTPCIGARDDEQSRAIATALSARPTAEVRSLRRGNDSDQTAWCVGDGWWLSTVAPENNSGDDALHAAGADAP
jgi:protein-L-isoaspartate(D-aspartate) O-methyltransferase